MKCTPRCATRCTKLFHIEFGANSKKEKTRTKTSGSARDKKKGTSDMTGLAYAVTVQEPYQKCKAHYSLPDKYGMTDTTEKHNENRLKKVIEASRKVLHILTFLLFSTVVLDL